jgi:hypothetical protein
MARRSLLLTPEVCSWLSALADDDFGQVACYLDLLCERGGRLAEPHSRALRGRLRQLQVPGHRRPRRLTYYLEGEHAVVVLTVWRRWRPARHELERAVAALRRQPRKGRTERSRDGSPRPVG